MGGLVLIFLNFFIIVNCYVCWYHCNIHLVKNLLSHSLLLEFSTCLLKCPSSKGTSAQFSVTILQEMRENMFGVITLALF